MSNVTFASHNRGIIPIIGEIASVNLVGMDDRVVVGRMTSVTSSSDEMSKSKSFHRIMREVNKKVTYRPQ